MAFGKNFKFGDATSKRSIIEKLKLQAEEIKFIQILDVDAGIRTITHFLKGVGSFHCWREEDDEGNIVGFGECCNLMETLKQNGKFAAERFSIPIMAYSVSPDGKKPAFPVTFYRLEFTEEEYKNLIEEVEVLGIDNIADIKNYILRVKGTEKGKGEYKRISPTIKIINSGKITIPQEVNNQIVDFLNLYKDNIKDCIAKTIDSEKLNKMVVNLVQQVQPQAQLPQQIQQPQQQVQPQVQPQYVQPQAQPIQQSVVQPVQSQVQPIQPQAPVQPEPEINDVSFGEGDFDFSFVEDIDFES